MVVNHSEAVKGARGRKNLVVFGFFCTFIRISCLSGAKMGATSNHVKNKKMFVELNQNCIQAVQTSKLMTFYASNTWMKDNAFLTWKSTSHLQGRRTAIAGNGAILSCCDN